MSLAPRHTVSKRRKTNSQPALVKVALHRRSQYFPHAKHQRVLRHTGRGSVHHCSMTGHASLLHVGLLLSLSIIVAPQLWTPTTFSQSCTPQRNGCVECALAPTMCAACYDANALLGIDAAGAACLQACTVQTSTTCVLCQPGFFLSNGACTRCSPHCVACASISVYVVALFVVEVHTGISYFAFAVCGCQHQVCCLRIRFFSSVHQCPQHSNASQFPPGSVPAWQTRHDESTGGRCVEVLMPIHVAQFVQLPLYLLLPLPLPLPLFLFLSF